MKIICMGDSITFGFGLEDDLSRRWTDLAASRTTHEFINCGIGGDTTSGMLARCQTQVFPEKPDAMLLLGGINDISLTGEYHSAQCNVVAMVRQAMYFGVRPILGIALPVAPEDLGVPVWDPTRDNHRLARLCAEYAQWLRKFSQAYGVPIVDFRSPFLREDGSVKRELFQDGLHPTAEGHELMAQVLCRTLETFF